MGDDGNDWNWAPAKAEWDVTLSPRGKDKFGHLSKSGTHINVFPDGRVR